MEYKKPETCSYSWLRVEFPSHIILFGQKILEGLRRIETVEVHKLKIYKKMTEKDMESWINCQRTLKNISVAD